MCEQIQAQAIVPDSLAGKRLDQIAAALFDSYSRSRLKAWVLSGELRVNGEQRQPRDKLFGGEQLDLNATLEPQGEWQAEAIELDIIYQDDSLVVINKPPGLVVHPAAGNPAGTLLNALLHYFPELAELPRAGIVHRLDKDTSGLMVVARSLTAHTSLVNQLQARTVKRHYQALVNGRITAGGVVDEPMGRHPIQRKKMAVTPGRGKEAITHYRVLERMPSHTLVQLDLETGRTHQIRVHMAHIGHSLVGDPVYGGRMRLPKGASEAELAVLRGFRRQALHAWQLGLEHPESDELMRWQVEMPADMQALCEAMRLHDGTG